MAKSFTFGPVGALIRPTVRRAAFSHEVELTEQKGLVDSMFRVSGEDQKIAAFKRWLAAMVAAFEEQDRQAAEKEAARKAAKRWWKPSTWLD